MNAKLNLKRYLNNLFSNSSINVVWLRLFYVYGPYQRSKSLIPSLIDSYKKRKKFKIVNPKLKNDYIHIYEIINILKILISTKNVFKLINVKSKSLFSTGEIANRVNQLFHGKKNKNNITRFAKPTNYLIPISKNKLYKIKISLDKGIKSCL